jgi:tetratricopeptide (TPR) repeat protein
MPVYLESLNNYETDQSVIFDLADSTVYFTCYAHFAAWNRWLKYNYVNHQVSVYKEADPKLNDPFLAQLNDLYGKTEACDWRDSTNVRSLTTSIINSKIENFYCLDFLSRTFRDYYKLPSESMIYTDKMIKKYPDIITGYYNKGRALEAENKLEEAIAEYFHALDCKIQCEYFVAETDEHLALAHSSLGKKDIAAEYATRALAIHNQYWIPEHLKKRIQKLEKIKDKSD